MLLTSSCLCYFALLLLYADAAALMLKHKVHRVPVVDADAQVIGMVTRTDIFTALEQGK